jgi:hypothetical protein
MLNKELINYNNKLYWVYRRIKESHIKVERINDIKQFWDCDIILRQRIQEDDILIFLKEIPDAEFEMVN